MRSLQYIIIESEQAYNNEKEIAEGVKIVVNTTIESVENINRIGKVIAAPEFTILKEGDEVIVHHNIMRLRNGTSGKMVKSNFNIEGNKYFVPLTEVFMYRRNGGEWNAISPYCFVKPIRQEKEEKVNNVIIPDNVVSDTHKGMVKNHGIMVYPNDDLINQGVDKGTKIIFSNDSEYEFEIDGEIHYKMSTDDVIAIVEE